MINQEPTENLQSPDHVRMGMKVRLVYDVAPRKDAEGNEYLTYYFEPRD